jgi:hypothetical protein
VTHAETIGKVVTALFILNTTYNIVKITTGLFQAAAFILGNTFVVTAGQIGLATGAVKLFRTALITTGIGALVVGLGFIIEAIINTNQAAADGKPVLNDYNASVRKSGEDAQVAAGRYGPLISRVKEYNAALRDSPVNRLNPRQADQAAGITDTGFTGLPEFDFGASLNLGAGGGGTKQLSLGQQLKREATIVKKQTKLIGAGVSEGLAERLTSGATPIKRANKAIANITKNNGKLTKNLKKMEKNLKAATKGVSDSAADNSQAIVDTSVEDALREKERVYKSFSDSVANTFAGIKDRILDAFSLPELGGSTDSIIRNMDKLLARVKAFSANITKLSSMGLDPKLLQQVINAGPIAGAKLAANLVAGGVGGLTAINKGYAELGGVAGEIGMTGTQATFGTQAQQNIYNLTINGGLDSGASIGKAVVDAIKAYERTSGVVFQGA